MAKNVGWGEDKKYPSRGARYSRSKGKEYRDTNSGAVFDSSGKFLYFEEKGRNIYGTDPVRGITVRRLKKLKKRK